MGKMTPESLTEEIRKVCGERLRSVVLYGSAAAGDSLKTSDYNVLLVLDAVKADDLMALAPVCSRWGKEGNHAPLMFARERLLRAADVFPVEFSDIKQTHRILYGEDPFAVMEIDSAMLRLGLERELRSKLLLLHENFLASGGGRRETERLMASSISAFLTLLKAALRLYGEVPPAKKLDSLPALGRHMKLDEEAFRMVWALKEGRGSGVDPVDLFRRYLAAVQAVTDVVDRWEQGAKEKISG